MGGTQRFNALCPGAHRARIGADFVVWQDSAEVHLVNLPRFASA
jgi:hypothetical protein